MNLDWLNLLFLPLMALTAIDAKRNWATLWDQDLTTKDRMLLQRLVIFWLLPAVVFLHELGHVAAVKLFGGHVQEFHFAFIWGYVLPAETFPPVERVWTFLSGNLVQIIIGFLCLLGAVISKSPPVVATLVYLFLWCVAGTTVMYALMSVTGLYGDWLAIYTAPTPRLVAGIAICHALIVIFLAWCIYGTKPRLWYMSKTNPVWDRQHQYLLRKALTEPNSGNWVNLGWSYYIASMFRDVQRCIESARAIDAGDPSLLMLESSLAMRRGRLTEALGLLQQIVDNDGLPTRLRARALMAIADAQLQKSQTDTAFSTYERAIACDPGIADPHYYRAVLLNEVGRHGEATTELNACENLEWLDESLQSQLAEEFRRASTKQ